MDATLWQGPLRQEMNEFSRADIRLYENVREDPHPKTNRKNSFVFSRRVCRQRNLVERFFNRIKQFRGIATRYDKCPGNYLAAVKLVATRNLVSKSMSRCPGEEALDGAQS
ncbi:DDE family transposase [Ciceribacter lividus]|uniref:DDE family transposase n=1 Tax=Ciceribacter lividus TaxID=1197950 RepID=A0A6I7HMR4_9HYPH|nr:DDE family transposase [Ciceribacter lividus]